MISSVFYPENELNSNPPDLILCSSDQVMFWVHYDILASTSVNCFAARLPVPKVSYQVIKLPDNSAVLNFTLHTIYGKPCFEYPHTFDILCAAVDALDHYGFPPEDYLMSPLTSLHTLMLRYTPLYPLATYTIAAKYRLEAIAVSASSHLLSIDVTTITEDITIQMGAIYFKRFLRLRHNRIRALRDIIILPPNLHPPTSVCRLLDQEGLRRAWTLVSGDIILYSSPGILILTFEKIVLISLSSYIKPSTSVNSRITTGVTLLLNV
jgi:hypothetical protein